MVTCFHRLLVGLHLDEFKILCSGFQDPRHRSFYETLEILQNSPALNIKSEFDKSYMVNDLATEFYPNATNIDALKKFVEDFPSSKYSKVVSNILANMSEMEPKQNGWKDLYLAVVSWEDLAEQSFSNPEDSTQVTSMTCINAEKKVVDFLKKGIAIPHTLRLENKGEDKCALVYRFYADKAKAEAALKEIKKDVPDVVGVVQLTHNPLEKTWTVR